jgi:hypothetical protein
MSEMNYGNRGLKNWRILTNKEIYARVKKPCEWRTLVSTVMNLQVPKMRGISWLAAEPVTF